MSDAIHYIPILLNIAVIVVLSYGIIQRRRNKVQLDLGGTTTMSQAEALKLKGEGYRNPRCQDCGYHHDRPHKGIDCHILPENPISERPNAS